MSNNPFHPSNQCLAGSTHPDLLVCEICNCHHSVSIVEPALPKIPWLTTIKCTNNDTHPQWSICKLCKIQRKQFTTVKQIKTHQYNKHKLSSINKNNDDKFYKDNKKQNTVPADDNENYSIFNNNERNYFNNNIPEINNTSKIEFNFSNNVCEEYFSHQYNNGNGDSYLVSNGCFDGEVHPVKIE